MEMLPCPECGANIEVRWWRFMSFHCPACSAHLRIEGKVVDQSQYNKRRMVVLIYLVTIPWLNLAAEQFIDKVYLIVISIGIALFLFWRMGPNKSVSGKEIKYVKNTETSVKHWVSAVAVIGFIVFIFFMLLLPWLK
ncbi:hypothetical protein EUZ85_26515 [Hahella sp. KA22]|uniref:hypothetical protein n=1 Tax=Hahella sp. KA22 TaxID=1628392 RepID=UPI000FDDD287|nr:hypothetical protein [Hahella sp. KA22]AZZ94078.1 hypothetical protein ENC22_23930 [Hahella sp. KA22]QAY57452.1 hypothetical protein EUZ85_26515 [Hahella sp. KA22]